MKNKYYYTLAYAAECLEKASKKPVTFIEYEDGSGTTFNYKLAGESKIRFVRFLKAGELYLEKL
jgi:hypothetical protein